LKVKMRKVMRETYCGIKPDQTVDLQGTGGEWRTRDAIYT